MKGRLYNWLLRRLNAQPANDCGGYCDYEPPRERDMRPCKDGGEMHTTSNGRCLDCGALLWSTSAAPLMIESNRVLNAHPEVTRGHGFDQDGAA